MTATALALLDAATAIGATIALDGKNLRVTSPAPLPEFLRASLRQHKPALVAFLAHKTDPAPDSGERPLTADDGALGSTSPVSGIDCADDEAINRKRGVTAHDGRLTNDSQFWHLVVLCTTKNPYGVYKENQPSCAVTPSPAEGRHAHLTDIPGKLTGGCVSQPVAQSNPFPTTISKSAPSAPSRPLGDPESAPSPACFSDLVAKHPGTHQPKVAICGPAQVETATTATTAALLPGPWSTGIPDEVAEGIRAMAVSPAPEGIPPRAWPVIVTDTLALTVGGEIAQAFALGWTAADLFGCDQRAPWHRLDRAGLVLMVDGRTIPEITADYAALRHRDGSVLRFRRRPEPHEPPVVMLWHLLPRQLRPLVGPAP